MRSKANGMMSLVWATTVKAILENRVLIHYVVYGPNQREYPGLYVVRPWEIDSREATPGPILGCSRTLRGARRLLPGEVRHRWQRDDSDDPAIVETWV